MDFQCEGQGIMSGLHIDSKQIEWQGASPFVTTKHLNKKKVMVVW